MNRDFGGYRGNPPNADWPGGARVAVSFVLNVEEGAELSLAAGDERNEPVHELVSEVSGNRDLCMESHFEYGSRAGYWRVVELFERFGVPVTVNACVRALESTPWIARDGARRDYEFMCHGYRWETHVGMDEAHERALIERCVRSMNKLTGERPVGWHTKSGSSINTRRLLVEEGGFRYDSDAYNDDLPYLVDVAGHPHVVVPYSFDTNDMRFQGGRGFEQGEDFARYCIAAFDWLWREGQTRPRMMTVGLHARIIGKPGRIGGLESLLQHIAGKQQVWIARRREIASHWHALTA